MDIISLQKKNAPGTSRDRDLAAAALSACKLIAPIWPLRDFVAVNPMQGLSAAAFAAANGELRRANGRDLLMPRAFYRKALEAGDFGTEDLEIAIDELGLRGKLTTDDIQSGLHRDSGPEAPTAIPTFADLLSDLTGQDWSSFVVDQVSFWAGSYFDEGQALWKNPWADRPPYEAWRAQAMLDRSPEVLGIPGFRAAVAALPETPEALIRLAVEKLGVPERGWQGYFHRLLATVSGWAGHLRYRGWEAELDGEPPVAMTGILATRAAYELALHDCCATPDMAVEWQRAVGSAFSHAQPAAVDHVRLVAHRALERSYQDALVADMHAATGAAATEAPDRPSAQAVFCIDVRSERFRRALEAVDGSIETFGFAGFFGLPIAIQPFGSDEVRAQCPVLLTPQFTVREGAPTEGFVRTERMAQVRNAALGAWKRFKNAAVSSFSFVEAMGVGFLGALMRDSMLKPSPERPAPRPVGIDACGGHAHEAGIGHAERLALAEGMIAGMSLGAGMARLVLLAGHGATTTNNPYASGLDCGACGGHAGDSNARVAAAILNDPEVRRGLAERGKPVPEDTVFVAGLHDTVTDDVALLDVEAVPASHAGDLAALRASLVEAGRRTRLERAPELGLAGGGDIDRKLRERSRDWSQVRPEWGLAGCAAFIAAPRVRTRGVDLGGRSFLHSYDWQADEDNGILELIMTAPLVVASWINLQYYASTVNNEAFGSGDKTLHNVVGGLGVLEGNGGDLRGGLPMQSVHDGASFYHTPLRLTAVIEAPIARIEAVLDKHGHVADLFDNDWLTLIAIEDEGRRYLRYKGRGAWSEAVRVKADPRQKDAA